MVLPPPAVPASSFGARRAGLAPEEVLIADKEDGKTSFTWAADLDLQAWLDEYTLRDLWLMGNLGGRP